MSETQGATRMNISVSRELKARMDAATVTVNWSAVASRAFEGELLRLESERTVETMDETVDRLLAADEMDSKETYQEGIKAGVEWAKCDARPRQLRRLEEMSGEPQYGLAGYLYIFNNGNQGCAWGLYQEMFPNKETDNHDVEGFWETVLGDGGRERIDDGDFARGFVEGALDVWGKAQAAAKEKGKAL